MKEVWLFSGPLQSGKNTAAECIQRYATDAGLDCETMAFADELRRHLSLLNPYLSPNNTLRWNEALEYLTYDEAKREFPEMCRLMQIYGTEIVRDSFSPDHWANALAKKLVDRPDRSLTLITDLRFENEFGTVELMAGINQVSTQFYYVTRESGVFHKGAHPSEDFSWVQKHLDHFYILHNYGTKKEFEEVMKTVFTLQNPHGRLLR